MDTTQTAPDIDTVHALAEAARDALPEPFRAPALQVAIRVEDFAPDSLLDELEVGDAFELTGLYDGIPMTQKSFADQPSAPDTIWLFRRPILDEWAARGDIGLSDLVAHVYVHELAHHFGWSDADIARIDRWWE
jgi:predicted Zn-dependent protease with MMP-like domain